MSRPAPGSLGLVPISIDGIKGYPGWTGWLSYSGDLTARKLGPGGRGAQYLSWGNVKDKLGF
jgi:hypothetical protein